MEKEKRKAKPNRRKGIILILLVLFGGCVLGSINIYHRMMNPRYEAPILADIENIYSDELVEERLLEYITIGESTCEEVKAFGDEYLHYDYIGATSCDFQETPNQISYAVDRSMWFCNYYLLYITFIFENDILSDIEYENRASCL